MKNKIILILLMTLFSLEGVACNDGVLIKKIDNIEIYLGKLNRFLSNGQFGVFKANNQRMVYEICIKNTGSTEDVLINTCKSDRCDFTNKNYEIKYLVEWYKDANYDKNVYHDKNKKRSLAPELLVNSLDTIIVDKNNKNNLIKINKKESTSYISSDEFQIIEKADSHHRIAHNASKYIVKDEKNSDPIAIVDERRVYFFENDIVNESEVFVKISKGDRKETINIPVKVIPFELMDGLVDAGIYYRSLYNKGKPLLWSENKTTEQLNIEFSDMRKKGIDYPTAYLYRDYYKYMKARNSHDFPKDKIFLIDKILLKHLNDKDWGSYSRRIKHIKKDRLFKGFDRIYFYLIDEPDKNKYEYIVNNVNKIIHDNDVGVFLAGKADNLLDNIIDGGIYILAYEPLKKNADKLRLHNAKAYSYANPQIGVYGPKKMRLNYGFKIVANGYSGIMPYAYQDSRGSQWSDLDHPQYRDHMLTYPTSDGLIQTVHGLALENAIVDMKYMATLNTVLDKYKEVCNRRPSIKISPTEMTEGELDKLRYKIAKNIVFYKKKIAVCS